MRERATVSLPILNFSFPLQNPLRNSCYFLLFAFPNANQETNSDKFQFLHRKVFIIPNSGLNIDFPDCLIPTLLRKIPVLRNLPTWCLSKLVLLLCQDVIYFQISLLRVYRCSATSIRETNYLFNLSGFWYTWITHQLAIYNSKQQNPAWGYNLLSSVASFN